MCGDIVVPGNFYAVLQVGDLMNPAAWDMDQFAMMLKNYLHIIALMFISAQVCTEIMKLLFR